MTGMYALIPGLMILGLFGLLCLFAVVPEHEVRREEGTDYENL